MNVYQYIHNFHLYLADSALDRELAALKVMTGGISSVKTGKLLNCAVPFMEKNEVYLEIGTFTGFSLASAAMYNGQFPCIGVDNFSFTGFDQCKLDETAEGPVDNKPIARAKVKLATQIINQDNIAFIEKDYKQVGLTPGTKIGVFYIDGYHTKAEVLENFKWAEDKLADNALIFIDDISIGGVGEGVYEWVHAHRPNYHEFFHMDSIGMPNVSRSIEMPMFWNGLSIVWYVKDANAQPLQ